ncbi:MULTISPECIES: nicotinate (nicotinamide) nucleotide adenylyltransferase [unclassified Campylobacter]|uniref:nicotinate (nicotinamide) nucleotide adenylyltransferase n=1 Tax=unclassified Campylobacter TaxID=2593542 RepID=UPI001D4D6168|nr:nicotinate (nicotinamide) nucleotide adenylyltransferase [Campylobacter sp. RM12637]MBZ7977887.1 nicotinate (nicotinamide) nucleotide adenylyltransferase [Campylobacter sp. RM12654]MBZ7991049.1 nicotinate (nicotinamide) nucleotide adenylyltransferase [Campylobacter sp. RM9331]MBZ8005225.1 nicotinate (nicotinamide) nucleotide adenylyltransferase [Campylobacter sp. RM9332]
MKIAIFGGSFDPVHLGHEKVVKAALDTLDIDKLIILPTYISLFKNNFNASPELRLKWLKSVFVESDKLLISDYEISQNEPVPSFKSVMYFKNLLNSSLIYFIIGADHLKTLHKWHNFDELSKNVIFVIASRDNIFIPDNYLRLEINEDISSSFIRNNLILEKVNPKIKDEVKEFYKGK